MTSNNDYADFTSVYSRAMAQASGSPITSTTVGWNTTTIGLDNWARSLNLLIDNNANILSLSIKGQTSHFTYLNATPVYDGGIYYIPAMPVVDTAIVVTWYQQNTGITNIYVVESDEPISTSVFNPISPTQAIRERLVYSTPLNCPANSLSTLTTILDATTDAVRCSVDISSNYLWGRVRGVTSGNLYYDGSINNVGFPPTPIPVDRTQDSQVQVSVQSTVAGSVNLYVSLINTPDFAGSVPIAQLMAPNELAPDANQADRPNQLPFNFDGTIAASAVTPMILAINNNQIRLNEISIFQYTAVATNIQLEDATGSVFYTYHYGAAMNTIVQSLHGRVAHRGSQIQMRNKAAAVTGGICVNIDYSAL